MNGSHTNPTIPDKYRGVIEGSIHINKKSIIGSTCIILPNSHLEEGVAIGALSLITGKRYKKWHL